MGRVSQSALSKTWILASAGVAVLVVGLAMLYRPAPHLATYAPSGPTLPTEIFGPLGGGPSDEFPSIANDAGPVPGFNFSVPKRSTNGYRFFNDGSAVRSVIAHLDAHGDWTIAGRAFKPGGGAWLAISDARVKTNIHPFTMGLDQALELHPVWYSYNGLAGTRADGKRYVGLIAQDVQKVLPFAVSTRKLLLHPGDANPTDVLEVDASSLTYVLLNSIKQLAVQQDDLEARIHRLEQRRANGASE